MFAAIIYAARPVSTDARLRDHTIPTNADKELPHPYALDVILLERMDPPPGQRGQPQG